ncbi:M20/M25/M40 family metallo-hydrolase [Desulfurivibrio sp. D14AmB]|uniref:M20/M25/M40 family metallo-hydrolase n=1 Tax=Desulfurivibrio sp. D14AmB TaxID=3374370 RepID=UPI00376EB7B0
MPLQPERLADIFVRLCEIDSPSRREGRLAAFLRGLFATEFKAEILEDASAAATGSDTGNLVVRIGGDGELPPLFFNCHLDTVEPARGVRVHRSGETFTSAGATVLGADDKAGIAMLVELARSLKEDGGPRPPLEFIFTTCEEIGLLGAKNLDFRLLRARAGFALDSAGIDLAVIAAPASNHFTARVRGLAAHAGLHPEKGVSAIQLIARAIAELPWGRLDPESTANIGLIGGGKATNIVPDLAWVEGEVRSHSRELLARHTTAIEEHFRDVLVSHGSLPAGISGPSVFSARLEFDFVEQFPTMRLVDDALPVARLKRAATLLNRPLACTVAGGGSDANIFNSHGFPTAILGIGMTDVHTTDESITLTSMVRTTQLLRALLEV